MLASIKRTLFRPSPSFDDAEVRKEIMDAINWNQRGHFKYLVENFASSVDTSIEMVLVAKGELDLLEWMYAFNHAERSSTVSDHAVFMGDVRMVNLVLPICGEPDNEYLIIAGNTEHFSEEVVTSLLEYGCKWTNDAAVEFAARGNKKMVLTAIKEIKHPSSKIILAAAENNHFDLVTSLLLNKKCPFIPTELLIWAARHGDSEAFDFIHNAVHPKSKTCPGPPLASRRIMDAAAKGGNYALFTQAHKFGYVSDELTSLEVIRCREVEMLKFLIGQGVPLHRRSSRHCKQFGKIPEIPEITALVAKHTPWTN